MLPLRYRLALALLLRRLLLWLLAPLRLFAIVRLLLLLLVVVRHCVLLSGPRDRKTVSAGRCLVRRRFLDVLRGIRLGEEIGDVDGSLCLPNSSRLGSEDCVDVLNGFVSHSRQVGDGGAPHLVPDISNFQIL